MIASLIFAVCCAISLQQTPEMQCEVEYLGRSDDGQRYVMNLYFRNACAQPIRLGAIMSNWKSVENKQGDHRVYLLYYFDFDIVDPDEEVPEIETVREFDMWVKDCLVPFECWKTRLEIPVAEKPASRIYIDYSVGGATVMDPFVTPGAKPVDRWEPLYRVLFMNDAVVKITR